MNKFFAISAAAVLAAAPLAATANQDVVLETSKSTQAEGAVAAFLATSPALAVGATVLIGGILFAVVSDSSSSSTTLVPVASGN